MTAVKFENATIRDVIGKAAKVAPTRGSAFDKAAGILMEVDPAEGLVVVKSTNIDVWYTEIVNHLEIEGDPVTWRLPSVVIDGITNKLPVSSGKTVTFDDTQAPVLQVKSGRMNAKVRTIDPQWYPSWDAFDPDDLEDVSDFAARIQQVQWAANKNGDPPLSGIHLTGEYAVATDNYKVARTPCKAAMFHQPVTIPSTIFAPLMRSLGDVKLGIGDGQLLVMPDDATQVRAAIFGLDYPKVERVFHGNEPDSVTFRKTALLEIIDRAMVMGQRDRSPLLKMLIGREEIAVMVTDAEVGLLGDVIEVPGEATHKRATFGFTPANLVGGINAAPGEQVTMHYDQENPGKPIRLDGGSGYEVIVMTRREVKEQDS